MPVYINISLSGIGTITKRVNKVSDQMKDLRPAFIKIGEDFRKTEIKVFQGQGAYGSRSAWKQLTPKYKQWKSAHYPGKPILQMTGALKNSLTTKGPGNIEIITKNSITLGSDDPKFKWHQKGTRKMAARPPITYTKYQGTKWINIIRDEILKGL